MLVWFQKLMFEEGKEGMRVCKWVTKMDKTKRAESSVGSSLRTANSPY